ncbi:MAG: NUDIX domain-containing protein [Anaerolineae bacterium]|nr:NUDIX domain-containing protein [Anaerolineae bacterium]
MPKEEQGVFPDRYQLIPRVLVFATRGDALLLIKGSPNKRLWANLYNGIGGHVERGEDILSAAHREFREETGLELIDPWLAAIITIDTQKPVGIGMYVFRGEVPHGDPKASNEGNLEWIYPKQLDNIPLVEDLPVLIPKIMSHQQFSPSLFAQYSYNQSEQLIIQFSM